MLAMFRNAAVGVVTLMAILAACDFACAATYYVRLDGNNGNPGTENSAAGAWRTIAASVRKLHPNDALLIEDGTYIEDEIKFEIKGSEQRRTTIRAMKKHGAKIVSSKMNRYHAINMQDSVGVTLDSLDISFEPGGVSDNAGVNVGGNWNVIRNCHIHGAPMSGIQGYLCDNLLIENNVCRSNCKGGTTENGSGISVYHPVSRQNNSGFHIIIRNNVCRENEATNAVVNGKPTDGNGIIIDDFHCKQNWDRTATRNMNYPHPSLVENNLCFKNGGRGIHVFASDNTTVRNNTVCHNNHILKDHWDTGEIQIDGGRNSAVCNNISVTNPEISQRPVALKVCQDNSSTLVRNNILCGNPFSSWDTKTVLDSPGNGGNLTSPDVVFPRFVDGTTGGYRDFRLTAGSPAVDAGYDENRAAADFEGDPRPSGTRGDIGYDEFIVAGE